MTRYELLLTLHILSTMVWVGGSVIYLVLRQYLHSRGRPIEMFAVLHHTDRIAPFIFVPSILLTLVSGTLLVVTEDIWSFSDAWISLGFGALFVAFAMGFVNGLIMAQRLVSTKDRFGADAPEVSAASQRILAVGYVEIVLLVGAVVIMIWKPGS